MEAIGPVFEIVKYLWVPLVRQIGYVKNLKKNFKKLNKEAQDLYNKRDDLVINTRRPGKVPSNQLQAWLKNVEEIENQRSAIEVDYKTEKKCFIGWCPDIFLGMKLGERMVNLIDNITDLKGKEFDSGGVVDEPPRIVEKVAGPIIKEGTSIGRTLEKIVGWLREASIQKIGIWGMGGVGKTTLMKNLNNRLEKTQMFNIVIWVTVSKDWNLRKVQNEIARRLSLNLSNDLSDDGVSRSLYHTMENLKYLLLLDDVWDKVNLEEVGIPTPNVENGCKMVLTTRSKQVCNMMETDVEINVEVLFEKEAWELFFEKVGSVIGSPTIEQLARMVVKECGGLPLAIIVVGGALRKEENIHVWMNALKELSSATTSQIKGMEEMVFKSLKYSYDSLTGDRQMCFLYGALYPEDHEIVVQELIEYWRAAGFITGVESLAEAANRGHAILKDLVDASLLERCEGEEYVKMHDVIRDLALRITSVKGGGNNKFLVQAGMGIENPPGDEEWKECNAISLMYNKLGWLPERAVCPYLSTLLLQSNDVLKAIPESFFESMHVLQVLDLSGTGIESLPPSIRSLVNLRGIYLNDCRYLVETPSEIGALEGLEALHLGGRNSIQDLPIEMGELTRLKCLHVSFDGGQGGAELPNKMIPQGIISRLSLLEDLSILLHKQDQRWDMNLEYIMEEVGNLKKLANFEFLFTRVEYFECFIDKSEPWKNGILSSFQFIVDDDYRHPINFLEKVGRYLRFYNGDGIPDVIWQVLYRAESFDLSFHKSIKKLGEFGLESMIQLGHLRVCGCNEMESLIDKDCSLPFLEELIIAYMVNLRNIWEEDRGWPLINLRVLALFGCRRLKKVLPQSIIQQLPNLQVIRVLNCGGMEEMIEGDDVECNALPKLKILELQYLQNLSSICKKVLAWATIEKIIIHRCNNLKRLPFGIHNTSTLKEIRCDKEWWESLQWDDDETKAQLQPRTYYYH